MRALVLSLAFLVLTASSGTMLLWSELVDYLETPKIKSGAEDKVIVVPPKSQAAEVVAVLEREQLIDRADWMRFYVERLAKVIEVKPGEYSLSAAMSPRDMLRRIESGGVLLHMVTLERGATAQSIAHTLGEKGLGDRAELERLIFDPGYAKQLGVGGDSLEGYLFPDVYALAKNLPATTVLETFVARFQKLITSELTRGSATLGFDPHQVVILASLVEVSGFPQNERRQYAALLYNRLRAQIPLEIDATLAYGLRRAGLDPRNTTKAELKSPWNTRVNRGFPPGPITNPSLESLLAAIEPSQSRAIYAVARADGTHVFCDDLECRTAAEGTWGGARRPPERAPVRP